MSRTLPAEGNVVVLAEDAAAWGPLVADRNAGGNRTALMVADPDDPDPAATASALAEEVFAGRPWQLVDARSG